MRPPRQQGNCDERKWKDGSTHFGMTSRATALFGDAAQAAQAAYAAHRPPFPQKT